ncbi:MAG: hypothetical protein L3J28_13725 [Candidatus Polarisedimenticolaceae bacterium]|nr:hypothetical protein [Candidatus Polarisedimenticolaceae bacterium]
MKRVQRWMAGLFMIFISYQLLGSIIYTREVAAFYGVDWSLDEHGMAMNGNAVFGEMRDIFELEVVSGLGELRCPGITSERGQITEGVVAGVTICCEVANEHQRSVPYIEKEGVAHYLCGKWPNIDHVQRPLNSPG